MAERDTIHSILAADFGSVNTRVVLIDLVDGAYRLVSRSVTRTTAGDPVRDVAVGLYRALEQMREQTGRLLLRSAEGRVLTPEQRDGSGVDAFLATASVGRPMRVVLVGLMPDVSITSGLHALAGSYVEVVDTLSLADIRTEEQQINAILNHQPDLIFIVGGTDAGAEGPILDLVRVVRDAVAIAEGPRPMVLYAGNRAVQDRVSELLEGVALYLADNVRPSLMEESLASAQQGLAAVFDDFRVSQGGGFQEVSDQSILGVGPTAQSYYNVVRYLGEVLGAGGEGVLAVDVGSTTTIVAATVRRRTYVTIRSDFGVGHSAAGTLAATTPGNIRRWLTWDATDSEIGNYFYNKTLRPATVPQTEEDLELEYALARETIRVAVEAARSAWPLRRGDPMPAFRPIIGAGAVLANATHPGMAALLLLDALQPAGVTDLWLDPAGVIPAIGMLAYVQPAAVVQMVDAGDLMMLGTAICAEGKVRIGRGHAKVKITLENGQVVQHKISGGAIWSYPLPPGQTARVEVRLSRGLKINGRSRIKLTVQGGTAGLIIDVRGRPLPLPRQAEVRARLYPRWVAGTKAQVRLRVDEVDAADIDARELGKVEVSTEAEVVEAAPEAVPANGETEGEAPPRRRWRLFGRRRKAQPEEAQEEAVVDELPLMVDLAEEEQEAPAAEEAAESELDTLVDDLRLEEKPKKRRFFRR